MTILKDLLGPLRDQGQQIKTYSDKDKIEHQTEIDRWLQQVDMTLSLSSQGPPKTLEELKNSERFNAKNADVVLALVEFAMQMEEAIEREANAKEETAKREKQLADLDERIRLRVGDTFIKSPPFLAQVVLLGLTIVFAAVGVLRLRDYKIDFRSEIETAKKDVTAQKTDALSRINSSVSDTKEKLSKEVDKADKLSTSLDSTFENAQRQVQAIEDRIGNVEMAVRNNVQSATSKISEGVRKDVQANIMNELRPFITGLRTTPYKEYEEDRDALKNAIAKTKSFTENSLTAFRASSEKAKEEIGELRKEVSQLRERPYDDYPTDIDGLKEVIRRQLPSNPYKGFKEDIRKLQDMVQTEQRTLSERASNTFSTILLVAGEANAATQDIEKKNDEALRQIGNVSSRLEELRPKIQDFDETVRNLQLNVSQLEKKDVSKKLADLDDSLDLAKNYFWLVFVAMVIAVMALLLGLPSLLRGRRQ